MKKDIIMNPNFKIIEEEPEIWIKKKPSKGDHIRVCRGLYSHHGIYISDIEVIHFTGREDDSILDWSKPEVISSDLEYFLKGDTLEVKEYTEDELQDLYPVDCIVEYARACLGDKGYNLIFNNCEHFANTCTLGRFRSKQVEAVFSSLFDREPVVYGGINMGLFDIIGNIFGRKSSGGSRTNSNTNTTYNYEPDKVKVAQIEQETKIRLAEMDKDKVELIKNSQIELLQFNAECQIAINEAKVRGLNNMAQTIVNLQTQLNEITAKRIEIIEKGSLIVIKEIESFYDELIQKIKQDNEDYTTKRLPKLAETLNQYEEGSNIYKLFERKITEDITLQIDHCRRQLESIDERQNKIIDSFLTNKKIMIEQSQEISQGLLESVKNQIGQSNQVLLPKNDKDYILKLEDNSK